MVVYWRDLVGVYTASETEGADELFVSVVDSEYDSVAAG